MQIDVDPDPEDKQVQQVLSVGFVFLFSFWFFGLVSKSVLKVKVAEKKTGRKHLRIEETSSQGKSDDWKTVNFQSC